MSSLLFHVLTVYNHLEIVLSSSKSSLIIKYHIHNTSRIINKSYTPCINITNDIFLWLSFVSRWLYTMSTWNESEFMSYGLHCFVSKKFFTAPSTILIRGGGAYIKIILLKLCYWSNTLMHSWGVCWWHYCLFLCGKLRGKVFNWLGYNWI